MKEMKILCPTAALGFGFPEESFEEGLKRNPDLIAVDAGSTDPGPHYLGVGETMISWETQKRDLEILLAGQQKLSIPVMIGSAGGPGSKPVLDQTVDIIKDIAKEKGYKFKLARIAADMDKEIVKSALNEGKIRTFEAPRELTENEIDSSESIVAQMGMEPFVEALKLGADVIVAGRAYDPAIFAAMPIMKGFDPGLAIHMGTILECGAMAAEPAAGAGCLLGTIGEDYFDLEPLDPKRKATIGSIAAHSFYENASPVELHLPGGMIDLTETTFDQISDRVVRVAGTKFVKASQYTLKLEGSKKVGYRSIFIAGASDPILISNVDDIIGKVKQYVEKELPYNLGADYELVFHVYGKNGVMSESSPAKNVKLHELGIVGEVVGRTQEIAHDACTFVQKILLHYPYEGRKQIAGNLAILYSPSTFDLADVFEFNIYHLMEVDNPISLFPITIEDI